MQQISALNFFALTFFWRLLMVRNSFFDPNLLQQMMPKQGAAQAPVFDLKAFLEIQRKNAQALTDAFQIGFESAQAAWTCQAELLGRIVQDNSTIASSLITEGTPEEKVQRQTDLVRKSYEQTVKGAREVGAIWSRSQEEAAEVINRRVSASLSEFKFAFDSPQAAAQQWQKNAETAWNATKQAANEATKAASTVASSPAATAAAKKPAAKKQPARRKTTTATKAKKPASAAKKAA